MPSSVQNVHKKKLTPKNIADLIDDEVEAIEQYDKALDETDDANEKETIEHIRDEEEEHIEELDGMEKMVDDMDSEQAWEDFKAGYTDFVEQHVSEGQVNKSKDGETSSIEGKLDTLLAIQQEQRVDIERLTDVIPQLKGDIEQQNELEETEGGEEEDPMADLFGGETEGVPMDGAEESEEGEEDLSDIPDDEDDFTDDEIAMMDEGGEEATKDADGDTEDIEVEEESVEEEDGDNEDDYIPIEDIMSDMDDEDESEEESEDEDEVDEVLEKMVHAMAKMNKAIKKLTAQVEHLEKENRAMRKSMTVQPMTSTHGQRPIPIRKQVGVVSKPPVGVGYTANQIGGVDDVNNRSFSKSTPQQILDMCNRVARL